MKRVTILTLIAGLLFTLFPTPLNAETTTFPDTTDTPYEISIDYLHQKGVINGYDNGRFLPDREITRAEFVKVMLANYGFEPDDDIVYSHPYDDVPDEAWFAPYVQRAWEIGLTDNDDLFRPAETITRVEATQLILNLLGVPVPRLLYEEDWPLNYNDVRYDMWYAPVVLYGESYGIIGAYDDEDPNYFRPLKPVTRGEATRLLYNTDAFLFGIQIMGSYAELEADMFGDGLQYDVPHLDIFADVWNRIHESYYYQDEIDDEQLIYDALSGMVDGLGDPHSAYMDPPDTADYSSYLEGELIGVGIQLVEEEDGVYIQAFVIDSPAEASGLKVNDRIIGVDDVDVSEMSATEMIPYIQGEVDTNVTLTVERTGENEPLSFTITRAILNIGYVDGYMIDDALYVDINLFDSMSFINFTQTVQPLIEENPDFTGFIIDVRDNPGGYLEAAKSIIGHFIPKGQAIVYINYGENQGEMHMSTGDGEWADYPVVILTNENSASASEILAIALKEKQDALLVGQTTYGKGTVQQMVTYGDGSSLKLTIAEWRSPKFHSINGIGLSPHFFVDQDPENWANGIDDQLQTALEVLADEAEDRAEEALEITEE